MGLVPFLLGLALHLTHVPLLGIFCIHVRGRAVDSLLVLIGFLFLGAGWPSPLVYFMSWYSDQGVSRAR